MSAFTRHRSPRDFVDGCVEGVEHLEKYGPKGLSLQCIQLRSPPRRVARIEGYNELQAQDLETLGGHCHREARRRRVLRAG